MARPIRTRRTRRLRRYRHIVEIADERAGVDSAEAQVRCVGKPEFGIAVHGDVANGLQQRGLQAISQRRDTRMVARQLKSRNPAGLAEADDASDIQRAAATASFLSAADDERLEFHAVFAATHEKCADALR